MRQNLHTHSVYCDGIDTLDHMCEKAVEKGFDILGFSGHSYINEDETWAMSIEGTRSYIEEVRKLQKAYAGKMEIFLGIEEDSLNRLSVKEPFEFVIGSVHFLRHKGMALPVDYNSGILEYMQDAGYSGSFENMAEDYYADIRQMRTWDEVDIVGHLDLITKFNEDESFIRFDDPAYVRAATDTVDAFAGVKIMEVNTGAIGRGYRKTPYPYRNLLEYMHAKNVQICLNSDCHNAEWLDCSFAESLELIKACGYTAMMKKTKEGFEETDIDLFR